MTGEIRYEYTNKDCLQFIEDMEDMGYEVWHYRGRFYYEGPAISTDHLGATLAHTSVECKWDNLGLGWVVHPKAIRQRKGDQKWSIRR